MFAKQMFIQLEHAMEILLIQVGHSDLGFVRIGIIKK